MAAFAGPMVRIRLPPAAGRQRTRFSRSQYYSWQILTRHHSAAPLPPTVGGAGLGAGPDSRCTISVDRSCRMGIAGPNLHIGPGPTCRCIALRQKGMQPIDTIVHEYNEGPSGASAREPRAHVLRQEYRSIPLGLLGSKRDSAPATRLHTAGLLGPAVPGWVMADCRMWTNLAPFAYGSPDSAPQHQRAWGG
jgi:hypothetical protein